MVVGVDYRYKEPDLLLCHAIVICPLYGYVMCFVSINIITLNYFSPYKLYAIIVDLDSYSCDKISGMFAAKEEKDGCFCIWGGWNWWSAESTHSG